MEEPIIKINDVYKRYKLGVIGGGTLSADLQSWWARLRHKEDPNSIIGSGRYGEKGTFMALNGVSFEVNKGEAVGIIGKNGAGKSTLLKLLSRVTAPTKGTIEHYGRIASMLEVGTGFHPELTGRENIYMNGAILGMAKAEVDCKISEIIEFSECGPFIDTPVKRYSSGMYVKLAFSVAAHLDSEILLMDEVLAVGDMSFQRKCINRMINLVKNEGRTVLYVSHNMNTVRMLCDRCIVLKDGKVVYQGDVESSIQKYMDHYVKKEQDIDLTKIKRGDWLGERKCNMLTCHILNSDAVVNDGEPLQFELTWEAKESIDKLYFRTQYRIFGDPITSSFIDKPIKCHKGINNAVFSIDVENLIPNIYEVVFVLYEKSETGASIDCDCLVAMNFERISNNPIFENWNLGMWGKTKMNNFTIINKL